MSQVNEHWTTVRDIIHNSAEVNVGYKKGKTSKKSWVTQEMVQKMEDRRRWKRVDSVSGRKIHRKLNNQLRKETERAREQWWKEQCNLMG